MYESFYGLKDKPFSMLPDPGFLFLSKKHQAALTLLEYALYNNAGFCVITGDIGAGKTTLLRKLLENMEDNLTVGMITNTHQSFGELLDWVLSAFGIHKPGLNKVEMHQVFIDFLLQQYAGNKTVLLIVDEAQNMDTRTLEELRMLSNINSEKDQLLQIILAGQPELKQALRQPELKQFVQRIAVDYHLGPLNLEETFGYIQHRLITAGAKRNVFTPLACQRIFEYSGGIPRLINLLCDTSMVYGFADQAKLIGENLVDEMVRERMTDSLVPIIRSTQHAPDKASGIETTSKKNKSPEQGVGSRLEITPASSPHLTQVSTDQKMQVAIPSAEKKTADKTLKPVAVTSQYTALQVSLKAEELAPAAEPGPVESSSEEVLTDEAESNPEPEVAHVVAADNGQAAPVKHEDFKPIFDIEATFLAEDETQAASQLEAATHVPRAEPPHPARQRVENRVEIKQAPPVKESKLFDIWTVMALVILVLVILFLFIRAIDFSSTRDVVESKPAPIVEPHPPAVTQAENELSDEVKRKLEEAEKVKLELERVQREEQARREQLEAETLAMQQQRDAALAAAEEEKQARLKKAEEAKKAARRAQALEAKQAKLKAEMEAARALAQQELEKKQQAEAEAAEKLAIEHEVKLVIEQEEQRARELELEWRNAQIQAIPASRETAAVSQSVPSWKTPATTLAPQSDAEVQSQTAKADNGVPASEFILDPCTGPSARFLSTCR